MNAFLSVFSAELLKTRRSLLLKVSLLVPAIFVLIEWIGALQRNSLGIEAGVNFWSAIAESFSRIWLFLLYPLLITLQTALIGEMDFRYNTWKVAFSQPKKRWQVVAAKQALAFLVAFIALVCFFACTLLFGLSLRYLKPEFHVDAFIPVAELAWFYLAPFIISLFIIAILTWVSLNWGNFIVSCSTGTICMLVALFLFDHEYSKFYPWDMPGLGLYRLLEGKPLSDLIILNLALCVGFSLAANLWLTHKEIER